MENSTKRTRANPVFMLLRFGISGGLIGLILYLYRGQLPKVGEIIANVDPFWAIAACVLFFANLVVIAFRLKWLFNLHGIAFSVGFSYYLNLIAFFFNNVLPSAVGGEAVKGYYAYKHSGKNVKSLSAIFVDRLVGLATVSLMAGIALAVLSLTAPERISGALFTSILGLVGTTFLVGLVVANKRLVDVVMSLRIPLVPKVLLSSLQEAYEATHYYCGFPRTLARALAMTVLAQMVYVLLNYMLALSLGLSIPLSFFFLFIPLSLIFGVAPSVNGIGVREAAYIFFLQGYAGADEALSLSICTTALLVAVGLVGGVVYGVGGSGRDREEMGDGQAVAASNIEKQEREH